MHFDDRFLTVDELASMLLAATDDLPHAVPLREQIVSGALTFAIVAGRPVVSTPYRYAEDLLRRGAGVLVPFDDPPALAAAVNGLLDDPERLARARAAATALGAELTWPAGRAADGATCCARRSPSARPQVPARDAPRHAASGRCASTTC